MHKCFPFQYIFSASLPAFQRGVHCTKALHPLTRAVCVVQCAVCLSTLIGLSLQCVHFHGATCKIPFSGINETQAEVCDSIWGRHLATDTPLWENRARAAMFPVCMQRDNIPEDI